MVANDHAALVEQGQRIAQTASLLNGITRLNMQVVQQGFAEREAQPDQGIEPVMPVTGAAGNAAVLVNLLLEGQCGQGSILCYKVQRQAPLIT